ncbi:hypothetical protein Y032_0017g3203 [Ancylostoma ceylanicum]|uniref:MULE transposase domain-containing protein n=1 Tax=Ancylostoma ceylanicum TaxID=53326 RepID=A0A016V417_9BILA|nr:hypothetical protein Y032_0017g3203 [Ancylostoma ceylanicum]
MRIFEVPTQQNHLFNDVWRFYTSNNENSMSLYEDQTIRQELLHFLTYFNMLNFLSLIPHISTENGYVFCFQKSTTSSAHGDEFLLACENKINASICGCVHKLNPKTAPVHMEKGSSIPFTPHAMEKWRFFPILHAVTGSKMVEMYGNIFVALKEVLNSYEAPQRFRILLDYEKAAMKAAKMIFTESVVQGCAFHLAQDWNRQAAVLGLRKYIAGKRLLQRKGTLRQPPVNVRHPAYRPCEKFLDYLKKNVAPWNIQGHVV